MTSSGRSSEARAAVLGTADPGSNPGAPTTPRRTCSDGHPALQVIVVRKKAVGGGENFVRQCQACGKQVGGTMALSRVPDPRNVPRWNTRRAHRAQPTRHRREFLARYKKPDWKKLTKVVLVRDNYSCQVIVNAGGEICGDLTREVGHLTYERFGHERKEDLQAQCRTHNLRERERRITKRVLGTG